MRPPAKRQLTYPLLPDTVNMPDPLWPFVMSQVCVSPTAGASRHALRETVQALRQRVPEGLSPAKEKGAEWWASCLLAFTPPPYGVLHVHEPTPRPTMQRNTEATLTRPNE